jgi:oxygen-dependent protoporphyrinogen oxidase
MTRRGGILHRVSRPVVIVGGGPSGLATAWFLRDRLGGDAPILVLEASDRPGGKVLTRELAGLPVDAGPDAMLARGADLRALVDGVGLAGELVEPLPGGAYVWSRGRLRPLPTGAAFGVPERIAPLLRSGLLSPLGALRAGLDVVLPRRPLPADPSVRELLEPRFGREVSERMVDPLLGGVHAGDPALLSARSSAPEVASLADGGRSLILALRRRRRATAPPRGVPRPAPLVSIRGGLGRLTDALADALGPAAVRTGARAAALERAADGIDVVLADGERVGAAHVVLAVPAGAAADLLDGLAPAAAGELRGIPHVGVANAVLAYRVEDVPALPPGTGFLVPPVEGALLVGCTWLTGKWPHLANDRVVIVRGMVGRAGDDRWDAMGDDALVAGIRADLERTIGFAADPIEVAVQRWPLAMPQYVVGHADRLARIDAALAEVGGVELTGASYRGVGLAGCATQAREAAERVAVMVGGGFPKGSDPFGK